MSKRLTNGTSVVTVSDETAALLDASWVPVEVPKANKK